MKQRIGFRLNINEKKVIFEKEMKTFSYDLDLFFYFIYSLKIKTQKDFLERGRKESEGESERTRSKPRSRCIPWGGRSRARTRGYSFAWTWPRSSRAGCALYRPGHSAATPSSPWTWWSPRRPVGMWPRLCCHHHIRLFFPKHPKLFLL